MKSPTLGTAVTKCTQIKNIILKIQVVDMMRSYHPENSRSHQNTELKPDWACLVLTWGTSGESQVTHCIAFRISILRII